MIQTIPGSEIPRPSDDEIARVEAWQKVCSFMAMDELMQKEITDEPIHFQGIVVNDSFSKRALLGMIYLLAKRSGLVADKRTKA